MATPLAQKITLGGKTYETLEEMPPELRATYEKLQGALDADGNGVPDFLEGKGPGFFGTIRAIRDAAQELQKAGNTPASVDRIDASREAPPTPRIARRKTEGVGRVQVGLLVVGLLLVGIYLLYGTSP